MWKVEYTDQFEDWWLTLSEREQEAVTAAVEALEDRVRLWAGPLWT
jgi:hypothetical protein